jgi:hypothetical protein
MEMEPFSPFSTPPAQAMTVKTNLSLIGMISVLMGDFYTTEIVRPLATVETFQLPLLPVFFLYEGRDLRNFVI